MNNKDKLAGLIDLERRIRNTWMPGTGYAALVAVIRDYQLMIATTAATEARKLDGSST